MRTHFFTTVLPAINRWFEEAVVETGDEFSLIYIIITLFVNNVQSSVTFLISFFIVKK